MRTLPSSRRSAKATKRTFLVPTLWPWQPLLWHRSASEAHRTSLARPSAGEAAARKGRGGPHGQSCEGKGIEPIERRPNSLLELAGKIAVLRRSCETVPEELAPASTQCCKSSRTSRYTGTLRFKPTRSLRGARHRKGTWTHSFKTTPLATPRFYTKSCAPPAATDHTQTKSDPEFDQIPHEPVVNKAIVAATLQYARVDTMLQIPLETFEALP